MFLVLLLVVRKRVAPFRHLDGASGLFLVSLFSVRSLVGGAASGMSPF